MPHTRSFSWFLLVPDDRHLCVQRIARDGAGPAESRSWPGITTSIRSDRVLFFDAAHRVDGIFGGLDRETVLLEHVAEKQQLVFESSTTRTLEWTLLDFCLTAPTAERPAATDPW